MGAGGGVWHVWVKTRLTYTVYVFLLLQDGELLHELLIKWGNKSYKYYMNTSNIQPNINTFLNNNLCLFI